MGLRKCAYTIRRDPIGLRRVCNELDMRGFAYIDRGVCAGSCTYRIVCEFRPRAE